MPRESFHHAMGVLQDKIQVLGSRVEGALLDAVRAL